MLCHSLISELNKITTLKVPTRPFDFITTYPFLLIHREGNTISYQYSVVQLCNYQPNCNRYFNHYDYHYHHNICTYISFHFLRRGTGTALLWCHHQQVCKKCIIYILKTCHENV